MTAADDAVRNTTLRTEELRANLERTRGRVARACAHAGREVGDVHLIVVTKFFPAADVATLLRFGVGDIGESRDQEASVKVAELSTMADTTIASPTVHLIGQVQTKKAGSVARYADVVHSVDREKLVYALDRGSARAVDAGERTRALDVLVQVDLGSGRAQGRGGVLPQDALALARAVSRCDDLALRGVMAIAPVEMADDDAALAAVFARLAAVHGWVRDEFPQAEWLSAGMSGDLEHAVAAGATHLRVGSAILGSRPARG